MKKAIFIVQRIECNSMEAEYEFMYLPLQHYALSDWLPQAISLKIHNYEYFNQWVEELTGNRVG